MLACLPSAHCAALHCTARHVLYRLLCRHHREPPSFFIFHAWLLSTFAFRRDIHSLQDHTLVVSIWTTFTRCRPRNTTPSRTTFSHLSILRHYQSTARGIEQSCCSFPSLVTDTKATSKSKLTSGILSSCKHLLSLGRTTIQRPDDRNRNDGTSITRRFHIWGYNIDRRISGSTRRVARYSGFWRQLTSRRSIP